MGRRKTVLLLACLVIVCFGLCRISHAAKEPYKIGAIFSITGPASWLGEPERNTAQMIADKVNAAGGINGHPIELIIYDTEGDETKTVLNTKKLIEKDKVLAIIGPSRSGSSLAIIPIIEEAQVPNISCAASAMIVNPVQERKWVFKTPQSDILCAEAMFGYMLKKGITKIAIMTVSSGFGDSGKNALLEAAIKKEIQIVAKESYSGKDTDMTAQLTKIKGTDAQAIVNWSIGPTQVIVTKNVHQLGIKIPLFQSHGFGSTQNIEQAGEAAEGVMAPIGRLLVADLLPDYHYQRKLLMDYKKAYESKFGGEVSTFGGHAYDALYMVIEALKAVGPDRAKIRDFIENMRGFVGTAGLFNFSPLDHNGLTQEAFEVLTVKNGKFVIAD
jgi:branched-chain amino acid transport system substrate-binding protein